MTAARTTERLKQVKGLHYHEKSKALHLRVDKHETLEGVMTLLEGDDGYLLSACECMHLSLADGLFPGPEQTQTNNHEELFNQMCQSIGGRLKNLKELHIVKALSGFIHANLGAWCPVQGIQVLLSSTTRLESLMLRNLQVYSSRREEQRGNTTSPVLLLSHSLKGHPSLRIFGWQHSEFIPRSSPTLDPMLHSLSTIAGLQNMVIQSAPWAMSRVPTQNHVLQTLIRPRLQALHLEGLCLQENHIKSLLLSEKNPCQLQRLSLSLQLTLGNIHSLAVCLAGFIRQSNKSLLHLTLRLEWPAKDARFQLVTSPTLCQQRLRSLHNFQSVLANAIGGDSCLHRLDLIYYDSIGSADKENPFRRALESNYKLTHLRLPFCGEMDPLIDLFLKLNRKGLRNQLLQGNPTAKDCMEGLARVELQHGSNQLLALSMLFHLLRDMPSLFLYRDS